MTRQAAALALAVGLSTGAAAQAPSAAAPPEDPGLIAYLRQRAHTRAPIRLLERRSHGRRDLAVQVAGGGIVEGYEAAVPFDGRRYASNPTVAPSARIEARRARP